jgi:hypothetical protein
MRMHDAVAVVADERDRVGPADQQVAGVQAPADVEAVERQPYLLGGLDQRPHVRMQRNR